MSDDEAVKLSLMSSVSNDPVEGVNNRLKNVEAADVWTSWIRATE
jgi:transposase